MPGKSKKRQSKGRQQEIGQAGLGTVAEHEYAFFLAPDEEGEKGRVAEADLERKKKSEQDKTMTFFLSN